MENELYHHGILGMKWGVRRYQNKDGTLTAAGKKRYGDDYVHEDYRRAHDNKSVKSMSDTELRNRNNRLNMEKQYRDLTRKTNRGAKVVKAVISTASTIAAAETAYKTYKKYIDSGVKKLEGFIMADLAKGLAKPFN